MKLKLADDKMCFGCGRKNPRGLRLKFSVARNKQSIRCRWIPAKEFQGYAEITHGGILGLILDELMLNLLWITKRPAVTAELTVRFKRPAHVGEPIDFKAHVQSETGRVVRMASEAHAADGRLVAAASAVCIRIS